MRTTLTINDDVLVASKSLASRQNKRIGEVISALSRQALKPTATGRKLETVCPCGLMRPGTARVTLELVNVLRDELSRIPSCST